MPIEFDGKIVDIDPAAERLVRGTGGQNLAERFMRRDTGDEATLTVKEITSDAIDGTHDLHQRHENASQCPGQPQLQHDELLGAVTAAEQHGEYVGQ